MKKIATMIIFFVIATTVLPVSAENSAPIFTMPSDFEYDKTLWDYTSYAEEDFVRLDVYSQRAFNGKLLGRIYIYPYILQSNRRVSGRILQSVVYKMKVAPQIVTDYISGKKFVGMVDDVSVSLTNIQDDDLMIQKIISPKLLKIS